MLNDMESPFTLTLTDSGLSLPVVGFDGEDALNQPYRFDVELIGLAPAVTPGAFLHQPAFLRLDERHGIHGVIDRASCEHRGTHRIGYRMSLVPRLQRLAQPPKRRVFVQLSVPQIIQQLLVENALATDDYRIEMTVGHYPLRPFCIQYEESDLALLNRLCEEEGLHYHFEHRADGHVVVFADDSLSLPQTPIWVPFKACEETPSPCISALYQHHHAAPIATLSAVRDRGQQASSDAAANQRLAHSLPPIPALDQRYHEQRSRRHLQRQRCQHRTINGRSDRTGLFSGDLLQVSAHPISHFNEQWRITAIRHRGQHPSILDPSACVHRYHNDFCAQPWSSDFRPALKQPRPSIAGFHLAQVRGTHGQPAQLDEQGRVAIRLWPSAYAEMPDSHAIWLPVAMTRTQRRLAPDDLPCAGSEVWVSFLDGDPDRPILCLGNSPDPAPRPPPPARDNGLLLDWLLNRTEP